MFRVTLTTALLSLAACTAGVSDPEAGEDTSAETPLEDSAFDVADLQFLREEEKLARDTYLTLYDIWGLNAHQNIARSEQSHMDQVLERLTALGIEDPVVDDSVGAFVNEELGALYQSLVAQGSASADEALIVGATIEDLDIRDLEAMLGRSDDLETNAVYETLWCGSRNHMRAFYGQLSNRGVSYSAQFISEEELQSIVSTPQETCTE
ncbi:MAG: DUF2202 domain-containing protein [Deltaproteobacteria bacterium]|nr:DUF2202 domain-containing protein [Deltaproteobacteria bacterium]